ncbi:DNA methyltransferase [Candidatus Borrelia fainii]|uniref:site-specific DNA-methyltransferase (adenine-specific) n=2 Tax=Candidatus Borrelia fainii TaxID=2518322 RepID=A0ABM8DIY7_9SPIR|nr:DNA methyltransferase [Candidatus Borrelia fainii]
MNYMQVTKESMLNAVFNEYIKSLKEIPKESKTEHTDRSHLEKLLNELKENKDIKIQHEPRRDKSGLGAPDFLIKLNDINIGYVEVKKTNQNLNETLASKQIEKYKELSNNILLTNYLEFILIRNGVVTLREILLYDIELSKTSKLDSIRVAKVDFIIKEFLRNSYERITNIESLASLLAIRTKTLKDLINEKLDISLKKNNQNSLVSSYQFIKTELYCDTLNTSEFSDSISQTITIGLFLSKLNDPNDAVFIDFDNIKKFIPNNFSLITSILRLIEDISIDFEYIDIKWILNELLNIINCIDSKSIFKRFSFIQNETKSFKDPYLYFYEDFLIKYDKDLRKGKGVYYTPHAVVEFIVKSLHFILKTEFNLSTGFANKDKVSVLDFATGTGTFLLETIKCILKELNNTSKEHFYIENHILKNLYGFEYLMTPYTVANLKISQYLKEVCNFNLDNENKLKIVLTNTLDNTIKSQQQVIHGIFKAISKENELANEIKNKNILVILGNPPYSSKSKNNNEFIRHLLNDYKKIDNETLNEKAITSLNDDYVKFIRYSEYKIETSNQGLLGFITNNAYLDNVTFRFMRWHLLKTFEKIYILNLNGNLRKKDRFDNETDENVFDIQTGVAIAIFIKTKQKTNPNELATVLYKSIKNTREYKYSYLELNDIDTIDFETLKPSPPYYFFVKKDFINESLYNNENSISLKDIFIEYSISVKTHKDKIAIDFTKSELLDKLRDFAYLNENDARVKYDIQKDSRDWKLQKAQKFLKDTNIDSKHVKRITYKPFDTRFVYYSVIKGGVVSYPVYNIMKHILEIDNNIALITSRLLHIDFKHAFISNILVDIHSISDAYLFPLYIKNNNTIINNEIKENFKDTFRNFINNKYCKAYNPNEILGYIYAILYSNIYRNKFIEFLKIDYPKIIFVNEVETFEKLSNLGCKLIDMHLLKNIDIQANDIGLHFSQDNNKQNFNIKKINYNNETQELFYNENNGFKGVSKEVFEYTIGSSQVIKSYLKYRMKRSLDINEIETLEKTIKALHYTIEIQNEIDTILVSKIN